ncbi:MAG: hypothetical protein LAT53_07265 [Idiomarina sp.]|nr:hypothetical protein [Idiomarina sp.]
MIERDALKNAMHEEFDILPSHEMSTYASRMIRFLRALSSLAYMSAYQSNAYQKYADALSEESESTINLRFSRRELYNSLTNAPFFSTLLLLDCDDNACSYYLLLAHLYCARAYSEYRPYLRFYQALLSRHANALIISVGALKTYTLDELRLVLTSLAEQKDDSKLRDLASFLRPPKPANEKKGPSMLSTSNHSERPIHSDSEGALKYVEVSTDTGETIGSFLDWTPHLQKTQEQERARFKRAKGGLKNALYHAESPAVWSSMAATPFELTRLLSCTDAAFIDSDVGAFAKESAPIFVILFLRLLGLSEPGELMLINAGSPRYQPTTQPNTLVYHIDKTTSRIDAHVILNAELLNVAKPNTSDSRVHYSAQSYIEISLPHPIPLLLKAAFVNVTATQRNHRTLFEALHLNKKAYRSKLRAYIKNAALHETGVSIAGVERAFFHYAKEQLPEVVFNFLSGRSSVQHHYISIERATIETELRAAWFNFLDDAHIVRPSSDSDNTVFGAYQDYHDEVGSANTLRNESFIAMLSHYSGLVQDSNLSNLARQNFCSLYLYLRVASTVGLRPVREPLPEWSAVEPSLGVFSVADKRVHHSDERRLIVLPLRLNALLRHWSKAVHVISMDLNLPAPHAPLMHYCQEHQGWQYLSARYVNSLLQRDFQEDLHNRSFRHVAASKNLHTLLANGKFTQSAFNLLMNHARGGVSTMNQRTLVSIATMVRQQRAMIEYSETDAVIVDFDERVMAVLQELAYGI